MAAFGIAFPKLTLCRSTTTKVDPNSVSTSTTTNSARTLSLSIKNVPSQPLHYDVSTTTVKKKPVSIATILAIDGETKQLPKNLSVFNELQLDDGKSNKHSRFSPIQTRRKYTCTCLDEKTSQEKNSSAGSVPSSLSPIRTIDHRPDIRFLANVDSKKLFNDSKDEEKQSIQERRSNHTFTPPTSSLSNDSSSHDLHLTSSSISVELPQLKYAIEKFLVEDDPIYQIAEEFSSGCSLIQQDYNGNSHSSNVTTSNLKHHQHEKIDNMELHLMHEKNVNNELPSRPPHMSNSMKWYVTELRINRPLIYRTQWTNRQQYSCNRKFSHSVNDLVQIYNVKKRSENGKYKSTKIADIAYSTLSLQNFTNPQQQLCHQSDDNILLNNHLSCTDDDLNNLNSDEDGQQLSPLIIQKTLNRSLGKDDTLIRNESVKKKLFDILNDDELENACLEDMSQEFEKMCIAHHHVNSFSSSSRSSDDALYSSPPNELYLPLPPPPPLSSSYNENLSTNIHNTTECYLGRSRLITTSLDKIPMNNNAYNHPSSSCVPRPSYEHTRPSWYTSPSPQWRMDDQLPTASVSKRHSSKTDHHLNSTTDPNHLLKAKLTEYDIKENKFIHHHHRQEQKRVSYSLMNTSTPLVDDSTPILPIIQDKSSNLLMFI